MDTARIEAAVTEILHAIGEDPLRPGLLDTPARVARFWEEFIDHDAGTTDTLFEAAHADQLVVVQGMRVWSLCEHHLLPFWCDVTIGYLTHDKVLGLSKFGRIAHDHAHKLQIQEQLVSEIASSVERLLQHADVAVVARGEHLCMTMRGVRTPAIFHSSAMYGRFRTSDALRSEFLALARPTAHGGAP